jgi:hypothetical protein
LDVERPKKRPKKTKALNTRNRSPENESPTGLNTGGPQNQRRTHNANENPNLSPRRQNKPGLDREPQTQKLETERHTTTPESQRQSTSNTPAPKRLGLKTQPGHTQAQRNPEQAPEPQPPPQQNP